MRKSIVVQVSVMLLCLFSTMVNSNFSFANLPSGQKQDFEITGIWQGTLQISGMELRIVFHISEKDKGILSATMDSPDQGASGIPTTSVVSINDSLIIRVNSVAGKYEGIINREKDIIAGEWKQSGYTLDLDLKRVEEIKKPKRPQEPQKPYPYNEEEVEYSNEKNDIILAGTLTTPKSGGPFPAVLLITGSGPQDRNESIMGHRPFMVIADHFTRNGIAVLRVDDRGVGGSTGNVTQATSEDLAEDVLAGVEFLKNHEKIDPQQIGLVGHSEGGIIAPIVAGRSSDIAFIVLMAGTGLPGEEILYAQAALIARANGAKEESIVRNRKQQEKIFKVLKQEKDEETAKNNVRQIMQSAIPDSVDKDNEQIQSAIKGEIKKIFNPWFRFFLTYDPKTALRKVKCPVLAIVGEKDLQVPPQANLKAIEEALKEAGNEDYIIKELPGLNHLFQTANTGSITEYSKIEETISPIALDTMTNWILSKVGKRE